METAYEQEPRTIGALLKELLEETRQLFKQEVSLAKTEAAEKASLAGRNIAYLAAGGLVAFAGALFLLAGLSVLISWGLENAGLSAGMAAWLGPAIVGLVVAITGYVFIQKAIKTFKSGALKPERTIESIKEDKQWTQHRLQRA